MRTGKKNKKKKQKKKTLYSNQKNKQKKNTKKNNIHLLVLLHQKHSLNVCVCKFSCHFMYVYKQP